MRNFGAKLSWLFPFLILFCTQLPLVAQESTPGMHSEIGSPAELNAEVTLTHQHATFSASPILYATGLDDADGSSTLYIIRNYATQPTGEEIGETGVELFDVAIDPTTGRIYGVAGSGDDFYELNRTTGIATKVGDTGVFDLNALVFSSNGQAFGWGGFNLYRINKHTGESTLVGSTGFSSGGDLAFDKNNQLFGTTESSLITIDRVTGDGSRVGFFGFSGAFGLDIDLNGVMYLGRGSDFNSSIAEIYRVDKKTGATTFLGDVGGSDFGLGGLSFDLTLLFADGFENGTFNRWSKIVQ